MWIYEKRLQYPVKIKNPNPALAKLISAQYGGPHSILLYKESHVCRLKLTWDSVMYTRLFILFQT